MWQQWGLLAGVSADDREITVLIPRFSSIQFHLYSAKSQQQSCQDAYWSLSSLMNLCRWEARSIFVSIKAVKHPCMCLCAGHRERTEGSTEVLWRAALTVSDTFWPLRWSHLLKTTAGSRFSASARSSFTNSSLMFVCRPCKTCMSCVHCADAAAELT